MIELFFDFVSPYSYLAWAQLRGRELDARPVLFAGILNALGTRGPAEVPARRAYLMKDLIRKAHRAGVKLDMPPAHPFNPLAALRTAALDVDPALRRSIIDALFEAAWAEGRSIEGSEQVQAVLGRAGLDGAQLVTRAAAPDAKARLRANTDEALARGAFGVPTLFVGSDMFFGSDSLPDLDTFLRGESPSKPELLDRWAHLPASATRG